MVRVKGMKKAKGFNEIFMPGEIEYNKEQRSYKEGIEIDEKAVAAIDSLLKVIGSDKRLGG
jgi:LDH2 family malate/lactate/ureidoglycolate dehydrogenase